MPGSLMFKQAERLLIRVPVPPMIQALWDFRGFILTSVVREFSSRYRESLFGAFWAVASPLAMIIIYTVVFSQLMRAGLLGHEETAFAFSIYLCAGVITWTLFAETLVRMTNVFLDNANLIKKANFPRICLPAIVTLSSLIHFSIIFALYLLFLVIIGHWPGWTLVAFLPLLVLQILFTAGLGVLLGTLNVFFRDVGQFTSVVLQFWFWLTPIVYTVQVLPERVQSLMRFNPMQPLMEAYQGVFLDHRIPDFESLTPFAVTTLVVLVVGGGFFLKRVGELVDEL